MIYLYKEYKLCKACGLDVGRNLRKINKRPLSIKGPNDYPVPAEGEVSERDRCNLCLTSLVKQTDKPIRHKMLSVALRAHADCLMDMDFRPGNLIKVLIEAADALE